MKNNKTNNNASNSKSKYSYKDLTLIALFTAIMCIVSIIQIPLPMGVPLVMQTLVVPLCGYVLGKKRGAMAIILYILIGSVGVPVFAGMRSGLEVLVGKSGGFVYGYILLAYMCGLSNSCKNIVTKYIYGIIGLVLCYALGVIQFMQVTQLSLYISILYLVVPFIVKDIILLACALYMAKIITKTLKSSDLL